MSEFGRGFRLGIEIGLRSAAVIARRQRQLESAAAIDACAGFVERRALELAAAETRDDGAARARR